MKRLGAFLLVLCAGWGPAGKETLMEDSWFSDIGTVFSRHDPDVVRTRTYPQGYINSDYAETPRPASASQTVP